MHTIAMLNPTSLSGIILLALFIIISISVCAVCFRQMYRICVIDNRTGGRSDQERRSRLRQQRRLRENYENELGITSSDAYVQLPEQAHLNGRVQEEDWELQGIPDPPPAYHDIVKPIKKEEEETN